MKTWCLPNRLAKTREESPSLTLLRSAGWLRAEDRHGVTIGGTEFFFGSDPTLGLTSLEMELALVFLTGCLRFCAGLVAMVHSFEDVLLLLQNAKI